MTQVNLGTPVVRSGQEFVPAADGPQTKKDFTPDGEVRWCPGCGDYAVLAAVQGFLPTLGLARESIVCISGIGCSSRFPYYLNTYGMHSIHGRAPAIATGLATAREDLSVWVVTGDGDALSIGGNHLIHALRRNVNMTILLFNNKIYGLTKGQYSPTSDVGAITKSTPKGSVDAPFSPVSLALGAEASFVARTMDSDRKHLQATLQAAAEHRGSSLVEIYQNCPIFNDGAFELLRGRDNQTARVLHLKQGEPLIYGPDDARLAVVRDSATGAATIVPADGVDEADIIVHDAHAQDPTAAFALSRLDAGDTPCVPMGIFRNVNRPTYDDLVREQVSAEMRVDEPPTNDDLARLLAGNDTWSVTA